MCIRNQIHQYLANPVRLGLDQGQVRVDPLADRLVGPRRRLVATMQPDTIPHPARAYDKLDLRRYADGEDGAGDDHLRAEPVFGLSALEHVLQVSLWILATELRGSDQGAQRCGPFASGVGTGKQIILSFMHGCP